MKRVAVFLTFCVAIQGKCFDEEFTLQSCCATGLNVDGVECFRGHNKLWTDMGSNPSKIFKVCCLGDKVDTSDTSTKQMPLSDFVVARQLSVSGGGSNTGSYTGGSYTGGSYTGGSYTGGSYTGGSYTPAPAPEPEPEPTPAPTPEPEPEADVGSSTAPTPEPEPEADVGSYTAPTPEPEPEADVGSYTAPAPTPEATPAPTQQPTCSCKKTGDTAPSAGTYKMAQGTAPVTAGMTAPVPGLFCPTGAAESDLKCSLKPAFVAADFDINAMIVATESIADVTLPPTKAPTAHPTKEGMIMQAVDVEVKVVKVPMTFPFTAEETQNPAVRKSLIDGFSKAIGLPPTMVSIGSVTANRRLSEGRRLSGVTVNFEVESADSSDAGVAALAADIVAAAAEGSIVANVQKEASANKVLTQALADMTREQTVTTETVTVTKTKMQPVAAPTPPPTLAAADPTPAPAPTPETIESGAGAISISQSCMLVALVQALVLALL